MRVEVIKECGYEEAIGGLAKNKQISYERAEQVALRLAGKGRGHDKFLRMIDVWIEVDAPRFWWPEVDQYKVGRDDIEDGNVPSYEGDIITSSESIMNSIGKRPIMQIDFEYPIDVNVLDALNKKLALYKEKKISIDKLRNDMPEGYMQGRTMKTNYAVLFDMVKTRWNHRLPQWRTFLDEIQRGCLHGDLLDFPMNYGSIELNDKAARQAEREKVSNKDLRKLQEILEYTCPPRQKFQELKELIDQMVKEG